MRKAVDPLKPTPAHATSCAASPARSRRRRTTHWRRRGVTVTPSMSSSTATRPTLSTSSPSSASSRRVSALPAPSSHGEHSVKFTNLFMIKLLTTVASPSGPAL